jgi:hypothetical protein
MSPTKTYYFEIAPDVGLDPQGNPEPAVEVGFNVLTPTVVAGEKVNIEQRVSVPAIPGTRIFATEDWVHAMALRQIPTLVEIDPPSKAQVDRSQRDTEAARNDAGTHVDPEEAAAASAPAEEAN